MAAIIIEDGTGKTDSNSYASEAELTTYAADRGITITGTNNILLIQAMDYIEEQNFKGDKNTKEQALQWPRFNVWIDGFAINNDEIPQLLKDVQMEAALATDDGNNPLASVDRETKREKIDMAVEVEYMDGARSIKFNKALETKLKRLLKVGSTSITTVAIRA